MRKNTLSSFSALYITTGFALILWQFYSIGNEMYTINVSNQIFLELEKEIELLQEKKNQYTKLRKIRSTPQYEDSFKKENYDLYQEGEIVLILPPKEKENNEFDNLSPLEIEQELQKRKPIEEQWKDIFLKK